MRALLVGVVLLAGCASHTAQLDQISGQLRDISISLRILCVQATGGVDAARDLSPETTEVRLQCAKVR